MPMKKPIIIAEIGNLIDLASTLYLFRLGYMEANPVMAALLPRAGWHLNGRQRVLGRCRTHQRRDSGDITADSRMMLVVACCVGATACVMGLVICMTSALCKKRGKYW